MARPLKKGLEYFPLDVDFFTDDKVELVVGQFGFKAENVILRLYSKIYKENGFFYFWGEEEQILFSKRSGVSLDLAKQIVAGCLKRGIFDEAVFKMCGVLTSKGIQDRYFEAVKSTKRKILLTKAEASYLIIDVEKSFLPKKTDKNSSENELKNAAFVETGVNSEETTVNSEETGINSEFSTQSKVKESKVNKSKRKEIKLKQSKVNGESTFTMFDIYFNDFFEIFKKKPSEFLANKIVAWIDYKKSNGFIYHPGNTYTKKFFKKLYTVSNGDFAVAAQALSNAISNKWQDVFPVISPEAEGDQTWQKFKASAIEVIPEFSKVDFLQMTKSNVFLKCTQSVMATIEDSENFEAFKSIYRSHFEGRKLNYTT